MPDPDIHHRCGRSWAEHRNDPRLPDFRFPLCDDELAVGGPIEPVSEPVSEPEDPPAK